MQLALRNSAAKIRTTFIDGDGAAADPTSPKVTITRDSDGEKIVSEAAGEVESGEGMGVVSYTLDASKIPTVDLLRVEWTGTGASAPDTLVGVVGGFLCSLEDLAGALGDEDAAAADLRELREEVEEKLETACNVAFRPSYHRETLTGDGTTDLLLSRPLPIEILSATLDGVDVAEDLSLVAGGLVTRTTPFRRGGSLDIAYSHGWRVTPEPIARAAVKLAPALDAGGDDRVSRFREDDQEFWLTVAGAGQDTGIPEVDRAIQDYRYPVIG